jgi:hypothetical protein
MPDHGFKRLPVRSQEMTSDPFHQPLPAGRGKWRRCATLSFSGRKASDPPARRYCAPFQIRIGLDPVKQFTKQKQTKTGYRHDFFIESADFPARLS